MLDVGANYLLYVQRSESDLCFGLNACEFGVNEDAAAVFANDDFLVHLDFELLLWGDAVEATTASVTLDVNHAKAVASIFADALEGSECAWVNHWLERMSFFAKAFFVLTSFRNDFFEFSFFLNEDVFAVRELVLGCFDFGSALLDNSAKFHNMFFSEFDFELLILSFF